MGTEVALVCNTKPKLADGNNKALICAGWKLPYRNTGTKNLDCRSYITRQIRLVTATGIATATCPENGQSILNLRMSAQ